MRGRGIPNPLNPRYSKGLFTGLFNKECRPSHVIVVWYQDLEQMIETLAREPESRALSVLGEAGKRFTNAPVIPA
jgi:hypothetical protein